MLLIGSSAAKEWYPDMREPADTNLWVSRSEAAEQLPLLGIVDVERVTRHRLSKILLLDGTPATIEMYDEGGAEEALVRQNDAIIQVDIHDARIDVADPVTLACIKRSQLYFPTKGWKKHMGDYHVQKARLCCGNADAYERLEGVRQSFSKQMEQRFGSFFNGATKSLRMKNEEFFGNYEKSTVRLFEHDDLHEATKYYERPLYEMMKDDVSLAYVPKKNFLRLSYQDQLRVVREEAYAIALERVVLPCREFGRPYDEHDAFQFALRRICTNLTRGWFRDAAIEAYPDILVYDTDYIRRFDDAVASGAITRKRQAWSDEERSQMEHYFRTYRDEWEYV